MQTTKKVKVWEEQVTIPTYKVFQAEKSPLFIEKRAYQGSTGKVYPFPVTEKISDEKEEVSYRAIYLENDYLQVMVLPELGGRIQRALDKTNNYDFVYYNHVIKPALVGLTGPWISGGIEFNWPQHHRPSTFSPVDYKYTENKDGSCTVYVSEIDRMYGTKGMGAFTLYPDKAYIEIKGQLFNRTDTPQTFLWWANPAVPVNENTYSVFPPDVHAVMDHGKRAVSTFPIATAEYYKYDYSAGIDISRYKNIKVPTSYMAAHSDFDFIGNYDEKIEAGLLHVADHHISPGKKQWTWGNSDFGLAWDRNLTETDGPYIELMTGVFTDNQPDFTWLKPYEEKTFTQYFMPYKGVGRVKNATRDAMINYEILDGKAVIKLYTTGSYKNAEIKVSFEGETLFCEQVDLTPLTSYETSFDTTLAIPAGCMVTVTDQEGVTLVQYKVVEKELMPTPDPAERLLPPSELKSTEELYLGALHLEQYRHATYEPADYYEEGLRRDASDIRLNNGYGMLQFKRGNIKKAIKLFEKAIEKQTWKNPNPYYGEGYFNLGLALEMAGEDVKAYDAFYKATWSYETQSGGFYWLACLSCRKKQYAEALEFIDKSLIRNWHNMKARCLKAAVLRLLKKDNTMFLQESIDIDPLCMGCLYEEAIYKNDLISWKRIMRNQAHNYLELSIDYMKYGLYEDAIRILEACEDKTPLVYYYQGYAYMLAGDLAKAKERYRIGEATNPDYCFPNKVIEINILKSAITALEKAPFAHYYLGNLLYDKKQYEEAGNQWESSYAENASFAMTCRNLAIYYYNKREDTHKALAYMKKAYGLEADCARFLLEYDQLRARAGVSNKERLDLLEAQLEIVKTRDVLYLEYITLLNSTGQYDKALSCLLSHTFHPWEGGEGKVSSQYRFALTEKAIQELDSGNIAKAIEFLESTITYPNNLGEGKLPNTQDNMADYYMGKAYALMGNQDKATEYYKKASIGLEEPSNVLYYNDQPSDTILYQGLANEELGNAAAARKAYHQLLAFGEKHLFDKVDYDYFAVSLPEIEVFPDNIQLRNDIYCNYLIGLGYLGLGKLEKADSIFDKILEEQPNYQGAIRHKKMLERLIQPQDI
ncbi:MAG TPA: DUF5107 domain-containing protein [Clostridiales bacterium]|nr:DUF5107 domain-containing protein [Clostridiales bacterium]